ncbi:urea amidolyase related protein [Opitutus terrae PB90-1]|uniref:Urea amidolyase related protein n=2 Tax=Opitutus terrae TaxID=107709 RepID=B1ZX55_OPITP|nr:urea amidolyase related protein [Opitutus terrae PB90-1]
MEMRIIRAGQLTTVQDLGRCGLRAAGVPLSGAMDPFALRIANALVGNSELAAALEFTLVGPEIEFTAEARVALTGVECDGFAAWKPVVVPAGARVNLSRCVRGCHGYLAIAGGVEVPLVLRSRSTYLRGGFGGWQGRALRDGDVLPIGAAAAIEGTALAGVTGWRIDPRILPAYSAKATVRTLPGAQGEEFGGALFEREFTVAPQSDRMGLRLLGPKLERSNTADLLSMAAAPGTIQVPPDGQPLALMADAQTIGGYPQVAHVISVDLPVLAQLRPGDTVRFAPVTLAEAHRLAQAREHAVAMLREGLAEKLGAHPQP